MTRNENNEDGGYKARERETRNEERYYTTTI
jgi:hypothetical protein